MAARGAGLEATPDRADDLYALRAILQGGGEGCRLGSLRVRGLDAVENGLDEVLDGCFVVGCGLCFDSVGDDCANGHGAVSHELAKALKRCALHLVIGYTEVVVGELLYKRVEVGVGEWKPELPPLGTVEPDGGDCVAAHHVVLADLVDEVGAGVDDVWSCPKGIPVDAFAECVFKDGVGDVVAAMVEIEDSIESDGFLCYDGCAEG